MKVSQINVFTSNYNQNNCKLHSFKAKQSVPEKYIFANTERLFNFFAKIKRTLYNTMKNQGKQENLLVFFNRFMNVSKNSYAFMRFFHNFARKFAQNREVEINLESNRLLNIAKSNEAYIFIMSHSNGKYDPAMLGILNTLLSGAYINLGKAKDAPCAKIIMNEDILKSMSTIQRKIYEKFGAVGIDANLFYGQKQKQNFVKIHQLVEQFCQDKNHIFIFPEGKMAMFKSLELKDKFQPGVGGIVRNALIKKNQVKVVPVGFAYNNKTKSFLGSIYIGEPICFKSDNDRILVNQANIDINFAQDSYNSFWGHRQNSNDKFKFISHNNMPITGREQGLYIAGVLCENLRICIEKAKKQLPKNSMNISDIIKI